MTPDEQKTFIAGLRNGLGLSQTCRLMQKSAKEISEYLRSNPSFTFDCNEAIIFSSKVMLAQSDKYLKEQRFESWGGHRNQIRKFVTALVLWEQTCPRAEVTDAKVLEAHMVTQDPEDAATSIGMTNPEMKRYIMERPILMQAIRELQRM